MDKLFERVREVLMRKTGDPSRADEAERILRHATYLRREDVEGQIKRLAAHQDGTGGVREFFLWLLQRRQGDVYVLPRLDDLGRPVRLSAEALSRMRPSMAPVALGEVSGHHHVVTVELEEGGKVGLLDLGEEQDVLLVDEQGNLVLRPRDDARTSVEHLIESTRQKAEHDPIDVIPGYEYDVRAQQEYTPEGFVRTAD